MNASAAPNRKQITHERIVRTASRTLRRKGYAAAGVAEIMKEAGLTHGGFYAHFASRSALLAEAVDRAAAEGIERMRKVADAAPLGQSLAALVDSYLSDRHLNAPESGCALAALGSETARQEPAVRQVASRRVKEAIDLIARQMPGWGEPGQHDRAMALLSSLVGAMVIARAVDDPALASAVRRAARGAVLPPPQA